MSLRVSVIKGHFHFSIPLNPVIKVIKDFVFLNVPQMAPKMALKSGTQDDTEGDTQMIPKDKTMTSNIVLYFHKQN